MNDFGNLPLVSFITINYNQAAVTCELLKTLTKITYPNFEIFVVDNASKTDSTSIKQNFPTVNFIQSDINLGFAGGNNLAVKQAKGDYLFFINNDTEVKPDFLEPIVHFMQNNEKVGMASPKIIYHNSGEIIQYAGANRISNLTGRGSKIGYKQKDIGQYPENRKTDYGHGAALIVRSNAVKIVGMMPEIYFLYYEEHDWCEQFKRKGYQIYFIAESQIYHKESMSIGVNSPLKTYYLTRNRLLFFKRNYATIEYLIFSIFFYLAVVPKTTLNLLLKNDSENLKSFFRGIFDFIKGK